MAPNLRTLDPARVEARTWTGEGVSLAEVLDHLSRLRTEFAHAEAQTRDHPHARDAVMNVVVLAVTEEGALRAGRALRTLAAHHPSRTIVLVPERGRHADRIDAEVESQAHRMVGGTQIGYEQVLLRMAVRTGDQVPSLVGPLLLPDLRTYLWWMGGAPLEDRRLRQVLVTCQGLIVDSSRFESPLESFRTLAALAGSDRERAGVGDLHWARTSPWREALAQLFNPPDRRPWLTGINRVEIRHAGGRGDISAACMLLGWMADRLGWTVPGPARRSGGGLSATLHASRGHRVEVRCLPVEREGLPDGDLAGLALEGRAGGHVWTLRAERRPDHVGLVSVTLEREGRSFGYLLPMETRDDAELLCHLLPEMAQDPVYFGSLALAGLILEAADL
ncbi:MAG: glucose-6-phosphate dehydrogenase assembly protein OpcA [Candidatus Dormibacteraceae bacterium]